MGRLFSSILLITLGAYLVGAQTTDTTLQERTYSEDVVDVVIKKITRANFASPDKGFMKRIACAESQYGTAPTTYANGYYGGVWQMDEANFLLTKNNITYPGLNEFHRKIFRSSLRIDWTKVEWQDLWKPLYSGLAARILLWIRQEAGHVIPDTLANQAVYWKTHYDIGGGTVEDFKAQVALCEGTLTCSGRMDLSIVLDGSGSVGAIAFREALGFVNNLIDTFSSANSTVAGDAGVRFAFMVYSDWQEIRFLLNNALTPAEMRRQVSTTYYPESGTSTGAAIIAAVNMFSESGPIRPGVAKVITVFTDGQSGDDVVGPASFAGRNEIDTFGVGIGTGINQLELTQIAQGRDDRTFMLSNFAGLTEFFRTMNEETCKIPQKPVLGAVTQDQVVKAEKRFFVFALPEEGITVVLDNKNGSTVSYYSYTDDTPSSAFNDGIINGTTHIPYRESDPEEISQIYISVRGEEDTNNYEISVAQYESTPPPTTTPIPTTLIPTTLIPTTLIPTTIAETTAEPTVPVTDPPTTTPIPTTLLPTTIAETTAEPTVPVTDPPTTTSIPTTVVLATDLATTVGTTAAVPTSVFVNASTPAGTDGPNTTTTSGATAIAVVNALFVWLSTTLMLSQ
ncbi:putative Transmembrane cell adhesion receptor mua-3 [Hypsibius exemplaris]|uniref:Transmembrane cell adhesion receptor mua-3 n=1 Tax=Hypsibius exemplaris TaxID=2072580 RepID=A0A1W0XD81_HYPEX|nr:putative Transmembrane cell adhesion receptor mua-3 [Hypsibius exemplaris]